MHSIRMITREMCVVCSSGLLISCSFGPWVPSTNRARSDLEDAPDKLELEFDTWPFSPSFDIFVDEEEDFVFVLIELLELLLELLVPAVQTLLLDAEIPSSSRSLQSILADTTDSPSLTGDLGAA